MRTAGQKLRAALLTVLYAILGLGALLGLVVGIWALVKRAGVESDLWAMIESLSTALAVVVAIVGAFLAYRDTASDRHRDVVDRLFHEMNSDESIAARRLIYQELPAFSEPALAQLTSDQRAAIKHTLNSLDRAGFMIQSGWIPAPVILPWISPMVVKLWAKLKPYVDYEAERRYEPDYYEAARALARLCIEWRAKNVPEAKVTEVPNAI